MPAAISVEGVSKRFTLRKGRASDLRERFGSGLLNRLRGHDATSATTGNNSIFWALKDVSFEVHPGKPLGIVGHNGSGKSTMLKLLTGIMDPTEGNIRVRGRVGALIEVGAGFHPDLTGRENVFLNGSLLGLSRQEIARKFDEIVAFSGLERFIDTPVKRYSSGMYMRLGFSVAAHTDPEILLIDEVLAVGDTLFQNKCLRHLREFVKAGGSVVFVSHALPQVAELCDTCVWLDHGEVRYVGDTNEAIRQYMEVVQERENDELRRNHPEEWELMEAEQRQIEEENSLREEVRELRDVAEEERLARESRLVDSDQACLLGVQIFDSRGRPRNNFRVGDPFVVRIRYRFPSPPPSPVVAVEFWREDGFYAFGTSNLDHGRSFTGLSLEGEAALSIDLLTLNQGNYRLRVRLFSQSDTPDWSVQPEDVVEHAAHLHVDGGNFAHGAVYMPVHWWVVDQKEPRAGKAAMVAAIPPSSVAMAQNGAPQGEVLVGNNEKD